MTDLLVLVWVVFGTQILWLGLEPVTVSGLPVGTYWAFSAVLVVIWMWGLSLRDTRSDRVIGMGTTEYVRVADASLRVFGAIAIVAFLLRVDVARGFLLISLPLGVIVLVLERWIWRQWLVAKRSMGEYSARVLLVGSPTTVAHIASELRRTPDAGYFVVGACVPGGTNGRSRPVVPGTAIPIVGDVEHVEAAASATGVDTVAITSTDDLPPEKVKQISWSLESGRQHLVLAPSIIDIAGPRIHTRPVSGLPLIHVETPRFSQGQRFAKRMFDLLVSTLLLVLLSPVLLIVALIVKLSSSGPVLYSHERVGLHGRPFRMLKFRSMRVGADEELAALLAVQGTDTAPLFKVKNDPRITRVGRFLRKYSLDELPQLLNVLGGSMSLVGPRPQVDAEVALYTDSARRRLMTRPGITGLWQVSGRSAMSWEDAVRLDLYYVENWTMLGDAGILAKTVKAVVAPGQSAH
ncbi:sugar transferase [Microbacterium sp. SS28]|uniref:sugar transferase n=1 Tax=Microbacterium sp. SS28 TaxID=2919948 RepID=UPI0027E20A8E|nr:sugar transferase [Microbacterium sp. SS28]